MSVAMDQAERARKQSERDANEAHTQCNELSAQAESLSSVKKKLETELVAVQADLDETLNEYKASEERCKAASSDAARLAEQLRQEQENSSQNDRIRKALESQLKEMQVCLKTSHIKFYCNFCYFKVKENREAEFLILCLSNQSCLKLKLICGTRP